MNTHENTSGQGPLAAVPPEIDRWNWGAFLLSWVWGVGNRTWIALLAFVPLVNLVMPFVLGVKGSTWAWRNRRWDSVDHFRRVQRRWAWFGLALWVGVGVLCAMALMGAFSMIKHSEPARMVLLQMEATPAVVAFTGQPLVPSTPMGHFEESGDSGQADFSMQVSGPQGAGRVSVRAVKARGAWQIDAAEFQDDATGQTVPLAP